MWIKFALLVVGAYLLGSIPAAYLAAKWYKGIDIRKVGTGNVGSSNVMSSTSKWLAVPVALFDMGKGALAVWIAQIVLHSAPQTMSVGFVVIAGHNWPVFLGFRGGKGMITSLGVITVISPLLGLIILLTAYIPAVIKQLALGVFLALVELPLLSWFFYQPLGLDLDKRLAVTIGFAFISAMGFAKRLIGPRMEISRNVPAGELLLNRLLFDRDIRDRKAWINRQPAQ